LKNWNDDKIFEALVVQFPLDFKLEDSLSNTMKRDRKIEAYFGKSPSDSRLM